MAYYENSQWPASGQSGWDHQTPPVRSGASSAVPREEAPAFVSQIEEVEKAIDNLVKSGKMFNMPGRHNRIPSGPGSRPHSVGGFHDDRSGSHQGSNLSNFYASQRQQPSRGTNEAEQMMQAKRRMAAQRERELRNYHQEQQYNRTSISDVRPDRTLSPGSNMSEDERRDLIARQRSALYGEGQFADGGGYVDETGAVRPGMPGQPQHPSQTIAPPPMGGVALRGHSPLTYEYGRTPPINSEAGAPEGSQAANIAANDRSRANSNASPQSNSGLPLPQQPAVNRTSNSSPGGSPGNNKPTTSVAPIGTRPSATAVGSTPPANPVLAKQRSTTPAPSPLSQGYSASSGNGDDKATPTTTAPGSQTTGAPDVSGWGGRPGVWGSKSGLGSVQASVWG